MKTNDHFVNVLKALTKRLFCKHLKSNVSSCPFTGKTYTICINCLKKINIEVTK